MQLNVQEALASAWMKVGGWIESVIENLPDIVAALLILVVAWAAAKAVRRVVARVLGRATDHGPLRSLGSTAAYLAVLLGGLTLALGVLDLDRTLTSLLAGVGIVGLALGFAFQDLAENLIAGVMMSVRRPFTDGDLVETGDYLGVVDEVNLRATVLRTPSGQLVRIPNADVHGNPLVNYSVSGERRVDVRCGVSYADDLEEAARIALAAVAEVGPRDPDRDPELYWEEFGGSSVNFVVRFWIPFRAGNADHHAARSEAMVRLKKAFDEAGVGIPFPITTLDFSDVGGRRLHEELAPRAGDDVPTAG